MGNYYTKAELYEKIHDIRSYLGMGETEIGFNMVRYCAKVGIKVEQVPFKTKGLRGMAVVGDENMSDIILLNSHRSDLERNRDCGHEVVHLGMHRFYNRKTFKCMDKIYANQDAFIEWQANEGASELFVPCKVLLPIIKNRYGSLTTSSSIRTFRMDMAELFGVTETVIEYRFDSLKYEINQYMQGVPIDEIKILSVSQQHKLRINSKSINDIEKELIKKEIKECGRTHFINIESVLTCI